MRASKVFLLLFILLFGGFLQAAWTLRNQVAFSPLGCRVLGGRFWGESWSFESQARFDAPPGRAVEVKNAFGAVRVVKAEPGEVKVLLRKVVWAGSEQAARSFAARIEIVGRTEGDVLLLSTNRDQLEATHEEQRGLETHLEIQVPPGTTLKVRNEHGLVDASDLEGADLATSFDSLRLARVARDATLEVRQGDAAAEEIGGSLRLTVRHGDAQVKGVAGRATLDVQHGNTSASQAGGLSLTSTHGGVQVEECRGELEINAEHGDVTVRGVEGRAEVATSFGDLDLERLKGEVHAKAQNGEVGITEAKGPVFAEATFNQVRLRRVAGSAVVTVTHGGASIEDVEGDLRVKASGDDVDLSGVRGAIEIEVDRGGVSVLPGNLLDKPVTVKTTSGDILLQVPPGSAFDLEVSSLRGEIGVEAPGFTVSESGAGRFKGQLGSGGSLVKLVSENGDVRVEPAVQAARGQPPR